MKHLLDDITLEKFSAYVAEKIGLDFPSDKWPTLEQSLSMAARELGFHDTRQCLEWFMSTPPSKERIESLASYLTIGESYFMREKRCFEILEQRIIPEIIVKRQGNDQRLRIWSAGCSTGEEPYSIAIMLYGMRNSLRNWDLSILATDINPCALRKAREGVYTSWSFRNTPAGFREKYFQNSGEGRFELLPVIRKMVKFSSFNLAEDSYPSLITDTNAMDVIFCRNVLMYFSPRLAGKVVERFHRCLLDGGWLCVSPCETSNPFLSCFDPVIFSDAILYRKKNSEKSSKIKDTDQANSTEPASFTSVFPSQPMDVTTSPPPESAQRLETHTSCSEFSDPENNDADSCYLKAKSLYQRGEYAEAEQQIVPLIERNTNDSRALTLLCRIYANQGRLAEALNISDQALTGDRLSAELHYLRAIILQEQSRDDDAEASLRKALYLDQNLVLAHFTLGNLALRKRKYRESRRLFNNALTLLDKYRSDDVIPGSDGMLAERLREIIRATTTRMARGEWQ